MTYIITNTDGTISITIPKETINTESYSMALIGQSAKNFGAFLAQNTIRQLENFASINQPNPEFTLEGQFWYDKTDKVVRLYDGTSWKRATNIIVDTVSGRPGITDSNPGDTFFNKTITKLEIYDGTAYREASYAGKVTSEFSNSQIDNNPSFYGSRVRTLFIKDTSGISHPVLAFSYVKSTADGSAGANRGATQIGEQYETIMGLFSDSQFSIESDGAGTATDVDGVTIDFSTELTQAGVGIASARPGRAVGVILPGLNTRAEYEATEVSTFSTIFAETIGSASEPVGIVYATDLSVGGELTFQSGNITSDLSIGGTLDIIGDIHANTGIISTANLIVSANTTLNGETTINGNLIMNGVNTQTLGDAGNVIEDSYMGNVTIADLDVSNIANIETANITTLNIIGATSFAGNLAAGNTNLGNTDVTELTVNGPSSLNSTMLVTGVATFSSDLNMTTSANINLANGVLNGAATQFSAISNPGDADSHYIPFIFGANGTQTLETFSSLRYIPSNSTLTVDNLTVTTDLNSTDGNLTLANGAISATWTGVTDPATTGGANSLLTLSGPYGGKVAWRNTATTDDWIAHTGTSNTWNLSYSATLGGAATELLTVATGQTTVSSLAGQDTNLSVWSPTGQDAILNVKAPTGQEAISRMQGDDIAHGMTTVQPTDTWLQVKPISGTVGGAELTGISDGDASAMLFRSFIGSTNPTDSTPAMQFYAGKQSGTSQAALGASETAYTWSNFDGSAAWLTITGDGAIELASGVPITEFSDDATLAGASNAALITEAAVKTYVDAGLSANAANQNLAVSADSGANLSINLASETLDFATDANIVTTSAGNTITVSMASAVGGLSELQASTLRGTLDTLLTRGAYLTGSNYAGNTNTTWAVDASSTNTASKIVARDANGSFAGNVLTAETLQVNGDATITGNLTVNGTQTIINTTTLETEDDIIRVNSTGADVDAGFEANVGGLIKQIIYDASEDEWTFGTERVLAVDFEGGGDLLTSINASNISSGTIPDARLPATISSDISGAAALAQLTDESADTATNIVFANSATGNVALHTGTNLTFNSSTGALTATTFSGSGAQLTNINGANIASIEGSIVANGQNITALNASNISTGTISDAYLPATISSNITGNAALVITDNEAVSTTMYLVLANSATGAQEVKTNTDVRYNATTGALSALFFSGDGSNLTGLGNTSAATNIADEFTDSTCFVNFTTGPTGNLALKSNAALIFDSTSGEVGAASIFINSRAPGEANLRITGTATESNIELYGGNLNINDGVSTNLVIIEQATGNLTSSSNINALANITSVGMVASGDITANAFIGDGSSLTGLNAGNANVTIEAATTTAYVLFTDTTGANQPIHGNAAIRFNAAAGTLSATTFSGSGAQLTNINGANIASIDGSIIANGQNISALNASNFSTGTISSTYLPLTINSNISGTAASVQVTQTDTGVGPYYPLFTDAATGNIVTRADAGLTYNATTGAITTSEYYGDSIVIGHTAKLPVGAVAAEAQVLGAAAGDSSLLLGRWSLNSSAPTLRTTKSRGGAIGTDIIVANNDELFAIKVYGNDGIDDDTEAAKIAFKVDGTPAANVVPASMVFSTANNTGTLTEALSITPTQSLIMESNQPTMQIGSANLNTGEAKLDIGANRTASGNATMSLIGDTTYSDYGFRITRSNAGANAGTTLEHKGTGDLTIQTIENGNIVVRQNNISVISVDSANTTVASGNLVLGTSQLFLPDGANTAPAVTFTTENDLGIFRLSSGILGVSGALTTEGDITTNANVIATFFSGTATEAQFADVAEIYAVDKEYESGTVVKLGGTAEITETTTMHDQDVFGIISTAPALLMNSTADGQPVAMTGRVPVKVCGAVKKGDRLASSGIPGVACAIDINTTNNVWIVIGRAMEDYNPIGEEVGIIEAVVGVK